ncbi:radical SAM protein [Desulfococcaceae bacterium HSG8]|nr:radical SAM protein [Desulfococcaceae bacterium HSG8]
METRDKPFIIPIFIPHAGCPHQCIFCNQHAITGAKGKIISPENLRLVVSGFLNYKGEQRKTVQIAFYGGTFLNLPENETVPLLREAARFVEAGDADSIRFSTRPDSIREDRLDMIKDFPVSTIEIGVQSMDDRVLSMSRRGHTASDTEEAVHLLKARNYEAGLQMMVGLPGDSHEKSLDTARKLSELSPDFVRIYPTMVLADSPLAKLHEYGKYVPMPLDECVTLVKTIYLLFREKGIPVIRMGLQLSEDFEKGTVILAGPYHPAFGHLVHSEIFLDKASAAISSANFSRDKLTIKVHPRSHSKMQGIKNKNIEILKDKFDISEIEIISDLSVEQGELEIHA